MWNTTEIDSSPIGSERCLVALQISRQSQLIALLLLTTVSSIVGVCTALMLAWFLHKKPLYHINIRLLLWNMCLAMGIISIGVAYLSVDHLIEFARYQDEPCKLVVDFLSCHRKRTAVLVMPTSVATFGTLALEVERAYATYNYRHYEAQSSVRIGVSVIAAQWLLGVVPTLGNYMKVIGYNGQMPYCISFLITPGSATTVMIFTSVFDVASLVLYLFLLRININTNKNKVGVENANIHDGHLSGRYQLTENLRTAKMMIPTLVGSICIHTTSAALGAYVAQSGQSGNDADVRRLAVYNGLFDLLLTLYPVIFCITCIVQSPPLLRHVLSRCECLPQPTNPLGVPVVGITDSSKQHFEQLDVLFQSNRHQQRRPTKSVLLEESLV